jgi:CheY-like chemotaxis protein
METKVLFVGVDGEQAVDSVTTQKQIDEVRKLECAFVKPDGKAMTWEDVDDPEEPRSLLQSILADRRYRVDVGELMADRPSFAVITAVGNKAVRLEFYEGHDALELACDLRSPELQGKELPKFMESDPQVYHPTLYSAIIGACWMEYFPEAIDKGLLENMVKEYIKSKLPDKWLKELRECEGNGQ